MVRATTSTMPQASTEVNDALSNKLEQLEELFSCPDADIIHAEFAAANPDAKPEVEEIEKGRLQRADVVIAVLSTPVEHPKIDVWEMQLSAGAVCTTLLYAAQSFGYAAQWLTEWYAYSDRMLTELGGRPGTDRIAGFIYIGEKIKPPIERTRPDPDKVITRL